MKLLPCPWCGETEYGVSFAINNIGNHVVECNNCCVQQCEQMPKEFNQSGQVHEWNTRAPTPREQELEAQNKALRELVNLLQYTLGGCQRLFRSKQYKNAGFNPNGETPFSVKCALAATQKAKEVR